MKSWKRNFVVGASTVVVAFGLMQLVPYRVSNPAVTGEPRRLGRRGGAVEEVDGVVHVDQTPA